MDLAAEGKKPSTLRTYRAAVAHRCGELRGPNPARDPQVGRVLSGLARQATEGGYAPKQADPLRWRHVQQIAATAFEPRRNQPGGRLETPEQAARGAPADIALAAAAIATAGRWKSPTMVAQYTKHLTAADTAIAKHLQTRQPEVPPFSWRHAL